MNPVPTEQLLLITGALREVGFDSEADLFRESLFDRDRLPEAIQALDKIVHDSPAQSTEFARETAFRMHQRIYTLLKPH